MSKQEKQVTAEQTVYIERTKKAIVFHREVARQCDQAALPVLAREFDHMAKELEARLELQLRQLQFDEFGGEVIRK